MKYTVKFEHLGMADIEQAGGKNASLGEMIGCLMPLGVNVPGGFATTADSFRDFMEYNQINQEIFSLLAQVDVDDVETLADVGKRIRQKIVASPFVPEMEQAVCDAYQELSERIGDEFSVAVRSSATAEDLPDASFAGQQETFLNVCGIDNVLIAIKHVFASLFNDRAISYRAHHGFAHEQVAISAGIQQMVKSQASGVVFTIDTESGFDKVVFITSSYGLGELVVQGSVNPDEFYVYKPNIVANKPAILKRNVGSKLHRMVYSDEVSHGNTLKVEEVPYEAQIQLSINDEQVESLARQALLIEQHYGRPMDIEWGQDQDNGQIYILQARPETVKSREQKQILERYTLKQESDVLVTGRSIGQRIGSGKVKIIRDVSEIARVNEGDVLVSDMTDPDWEPVMKKASAIVTNRGGRTCHAAIIARELGIPAVVGCGDATDRIIDGDEVTVSCAQGDTGYVYKGVLEYGINRLDVESMPELPIKIMLNVGNPERAFTFQSVPNSGVGLARLEFLISNTIGIHPKALLNYDKIQDAPLKALIDKKIAAYESPVEYYIERLKEGIATIAAAFYPKPVIVRLSDFKSNEYANLIGGSEYEPHEENPMLGFRGASRYVAPEFNDCFALECLALRRVREDMGLTNVEVMIPFVRTVDEAAEVIQILRENGLERGKHGLRVIMMCELPSNALLADEFLHYFDGFSIGSNDLTQLTLGLDRDSGLVAQHFDERDGAVKALLAQAITACKQAGKYVGICGQGPSDHQDFALWLMEKGIDSVSLNPDSVLETSLFLAKQERGESDAIV